RHLRDLRLELLPRPHRVEVEAAVEERRREDEPEIAARGEHVAKARGEARAPLRVDRVLELSAEHRGHRCARLGLVLSSWAASARPGAPRWGRALGVAAALPPSSVGSRGLRNSLPSVGGTAVAWPFLPLLPTEPRHATEGGQKSQQFGLLQQDPIWG